MKPSIRIIFAAFCLLAASSWLTDSFNTSSAPALQLILIHDTIIGLIALAFAARSIWKTPYKRIFAKTALTGIFFFGIPSVLIELVSGSISSLTRTAVFSLTPIVVILALSAMGDEDMRPLIPSLAATGGLLLLLPFDFSPGRRSFTMLAILAVAAVSAGVAAVRLNRLCQRMTLPQTVAVICTANALFLLPCLLIEPLSFQKSLLSALLSPSSFIDLISIPVLLVLLRGMPPVPFAARYLLIPFLTVLESIVVVRPPFTPRSIAGIMALGGGAATLFFRDPSPKDSFPSLR